MDKLVDYSSWNLISEKKIEYSMYDRFTNEGIIISLDEDKRSGLILAGKDLSFQAGNVTVSNLDWSKALQLINEENKSLKEYEKWRMPTLDELKMIYKKFNDINSSLDNQGWEPLVTKEPLKDEERSGKIAYYWSSTKQSEYFPWSIMFDNGSTFAKNLNQEKCRVRLVRKFGGGWIKRAKSFIENF